MKFEQAVAITPLKPDVVEPLAPADTPESPVGCTQNVGATAVLIDSSTDDEAQRAFAILKLSMQGESAIAQGQGISLAAHRARVANVLKSKVNHV
ncbi:MAG: hypothetical protein KBG15_03640 [Kofleriaceae bacterium]|nr:hypothetical protein [Kofleriaceae bacterium]